MPGRSGYPRARDLRLILDDGNGHLQRQGNQTRGSCTLSSCTVLMLVYVLDVNGESDEENRVERERKGGGDERMGLHEVRDENEREVDSS